MRLVGAFAVLIFLCASLQSQAAAPPPAAPPPYGPSLSLADARSCVAAAQVEAARNQWFMVVTVVDAGGHEVLTERMDNTQFGSLLPAQQKAYAAAAFRRSTKFFEDMVAQGGPALRILRLDEAIPIEGGLPVMRKGAVIGGVGVSGGTAQQDGVVAAACVAAIQ
jgi:glc operon protein GlcG